MVRLLYFCLIIFPFNAIGQSISISFKPGVPLWTNTGIQYLEKYYSGIGGYWVSDRVSKSWNYGGAVGFDSYNIDFDKVVTLNFNPKEFRERLKSDYSSFSLGPIAQKKIWNKNNVSNLTVEIESGLLLLFKNPRESKHYPNDPVSAGYDIERIRIWGSDIGIGFYSSTGIYYNYQVISKMESPMIGSNIWITAGIGLTIKSGRSTIQEERLYFPSGQVSKKSYQEVFQSFSNFLRIGLVFN